jgi:glyoxylase-like metal-dependent hydrolase (beta-lactamase superfamily II)
MSPSAQTAPPRTGDGARVDILFTGYVGDRVAGTVALIRDGARRIIVDPGMLPRRAALLGPLRRLAVAPATVTDVVLSHHHPDHTLNAALFPQARVHDFWAIYWNDVWESRPAEGARLGPHTRLLATPGHTPQDITTLVETPGIVYAFTHLWWDQTGPAEDPRADNARLLHKNRARVVRLAQWIVPGHGAPFKVDATTPR